MSRAALLAGNWKMFKTSREAASLVEELKRGLGAHSGDREVLVCPPFTSLAAVRPLLEGSAIRLGCQNMFWEEKGAFTGEVSPAMVKDAGCSHVIIGHSERRQIFGETDEMCRKKVTAALQWGLLPILCCGESLEEREGGLTRQKVEAQVRAAFDGVSASDGARVIVAYEPIWAIGTGKTDTPPEANSTCALIRRVLAELWGDSIASGIRILYGGSVKPNNIDGFMQQPDIDGALVGGASLEAESFLRIVHYH